MSSAKKAAAPKKATGSKKAADAGTRAASVQSQAPAKREAHPPAESGAKLPVPSKAQAPAKSEARPPAVRTSQPPAKNTATAGATAQTQNPKLAGNPYLPAPATVAEIIRETAQIVTLRLVLDDTEHMRTFSFRPGQVGQLSVFGSGESTFVINSPPSQKDYLQFSVMKAGEVSGAIHKLSAGDKVGLRAPLGNSFPFEAWKGKDVFFIGGGIGMAPIRTIMLHLLDNTEDYGAVSLLYGARSPKDMAYDYELDGWLRHKHLRATLTVDTPAEGWKHTVGLIPKVLTDLKPDPKNAVAVLCGPPSMIKFTLQALQALGFLDEQVFTTLEKRMKCGIGICGRCNIGHKYVCVDGPVFSLAALKNLPDEL